MTWFIHIVELSDGRWACCHGWHEDDTYSRLLDATAHAIALATLQRSAEIFLHRQDGTVESLKLT